MNRREALRQMGAGFGTVGLASMMQAAEVNGPLAPKAPHFAPKAKHVIYLFLNGGMSHIDTFDYKPELQKRDGQAPPGGKTFIDRASGNIMASPFSFKKYGQSGREVSELFPKVGEMIDEFCMIRSMYTDIANHNPAILLMNCGHRLGGRPAVGSWITYGLGTENQNLPGFIAMCPGLPYAGPQLWSSSFLPSSYQGVYIPLREKEIDSLLPNIRNAQGLPKKEQERQLSLLDKLNNQYVSRLGTQPELESSIQAMEVAYRMQTEAPDVFDVRKESEATRARYGDGDFGRGCLMALRLVEKGVRVVQVYYDHYQPWDSHDDIRVHSKLARGADGPIAALIQDLKSRGLYEDTLVVVGTEFGRTPMVQASGLENIGKGRDHNGGAYTVLLAGAGVKRGFVYGASDDIGLKVAEDPVHPHDLHATILQIMGFDHTRLTYRYSGRDYRLTDVAGTVVKPILA
jgi:hypothetical protein